jgi:hypothetical protein
LPLKIRQNKLERFSVASLFKLEGQNRILYSSVRGTLPIGQITLWHSSWIGSYQSPKHLIILQNTLAFLAEALLRLKKIVTYFYILMQ